MIDDFVLPEVDDEEIDIYAALGLNTPVSDAQETVQAYDPLAAFMDDDEEEDEYVQDMFPTSSVISNETG